MFRFFFAISLVFLVTTSCFAGASDEESFVNNCVQHTLESIRLSCERDHGLMTVLYEDCLTSRARGSASAIAETQCREEYHRAGGLFEQFSNPEGDVKTVINTSGGPNCRIHKTQDQCPSDCRWEDMGGCLPSRGADTEPTEEEGDKSSEKYWDNVASCKSSIESFKDTVEFEGSTVAELDLTSDPPKCACPAPLQAGPDFTCVDPNAVVDAPVDQSGQSSEEAAAAAEAAATGTGSNVAAGEPCTISPYMQSVSGAPALGTTAMDERLMVCLDEGGLVEAYAERRQAEIDAAKESCENKAVSANNCCKSPLNCLFQDQDEAVETVEGVASMGGQLYSQVLGMKSGTNAGQKKLCEFLNKASSISAGMNAAGAGSCLATKTTCTGTCGGAKQSVISELKQCGYTMASGPVPQSVVNECSLVTMVLKNAANVFDSVIASCKGLDIKVAQQAMQAIATQQGANFAKQCADAAAEVEADSFSNGLDTASFTTDCSDPANANSPYCLECGGPDAASNPFCVDPSRYIAPAAPGLAGGDTGGVDFGDGTGGAVLDTGLEGIDQTSFGSAIPPNGAQNARSNGVGGGGGGGLPPGGGNAQLGGSQKGGRRGASVNANVLRGLSGGSGYSSKPSVARVGFASQGGFNGYGRGKGKKDKGLDLKQFLPGGKKDPRKRGLAGLTKNSYETPIHPKEKHILLIHAEKVKQMCRLKRFWDCPSTKKKR